MILVDTTVWVDYFNGRETPETSTLDKILGIEEIIIHKAGITIRKTVDCFIATY